MTGLLVRVDPFILFDVVVWVLMGWWWCSGDEGLCGGAEYVVFDVAFEF
jgi:hypothetical protein